MVGTTLFTIGYEGADIDGFLSTLKAHRIETLLDVRDVPISRKRGFSKSALATRLFAEGISYLHLKGLGDPKPGRIAAREGRYEDFRRIFGAHLKSEVARIDLVRAVTTARETAACLVCFERDHRNCHRCMVANEMAATHGFRLVHLSVQPGSMTERSPRTRHAEVAAYVG